MSRCRFCRWDKSSGAWISECTNADSEFCGEECIEQQGDDSEYCDDREGK